MGGKEMKLMSRWMMIGLFAALALVPIGRAQDAGQPAPFKKEEIEQLVAPIALYPDALVAQIREWTKPPTASTQDS